MPALRRPFPPPILGAIVVPRFVSRSASLTRTTPINSSNAGPVGINAAASAIPCRRSCTGSDGPNAVIATALHELLPEEGRKVLAFADSRQEAAFFAWYVEDSYEKLRDRNLMLRATKAGQVDPEGLSVETLCNRLYKQWDRAALFRGSDDPESRGRKVLTSILREALTDERRLSLSGRRLGQVVRQDSR